MLGNLAASLSGCARKNEREDGRAQRWWQYFLPHVNRRVILQMLGRHPATASILADVVFEDTGQRKTRPLFGRLQAKDAGWTNIVGRRRKIDDERLREKVRAFLGRCVLAVDEDIGERRGRVT